MESLKNKSRITTLIVAIILGIITYISTMNPDNLANYLGVYGNCSAIVILICGFIVNQYSEEQRVKRAEQLIEDNYTKLGYPRIQNENNTETNTTTENPQTNIMSSLESESYTANTTIDVRATPKNNDDITESDIFTEDADDN